jgi:hypothetical protein
MDGKGYGVKGREFGVYRSRAQMLKGLKIQGIWFTGFGV